MDQKSTQITDLSWGEIEVTIDGNKQTFRDCKVWPGGAREWDWNETGTNHSPGIQIADIKEILKEGVEILILSRGQSRRLQVKKDTEEFLKKRGVTFYKEETNKAIDHFNQLSKEGKRVGGVFHTTC